MSPFAPERGHHVFFSCAPAGGTQVIVGEWVRRARRSRRRPCTSPIGPASLRPGAYMEWKILRDPAWVQRRKSLPEVRKALFRLAMPFLALAVAFIIGAATQSMHVFIVVFALGLALGLVLRFTVWR